MEPGGQYGTSDDVAESATAELDELPAADNVEVFTDLRAWMAAIVLLQDRGQPMNVTFGDDEDSQRFVRDARRFNRGWKPGVPVRAPRPVPASVIHVPEWSEPLTRPREQRSRRVRRSSGSRGDPSRRSEDSEPPPLAAHPSGGAR